MKRFLSFLITIVLALSFVGCGSDTSSQVEEEIPETTEQVIEDQVTDYSTLSFSELEVLGYDDDPVAEYYLGRFYEYGLDDVNQDFTQAISWYEKSAAWDNADATLALGYFYLTGTGVDVDLDKANEYFEAAELLGSVNAKVGKARVLLASLSPEELAALTDETAENEDEIKTDDAETTETTDDQEGEETELTTAQQAFELLSQAAEENDLDGIYFLGYCFENGIGTEKDLDKAKSSYENVIDTKSSALLDQYSLNNAYVALGLLYVNGAFEEIAEETQIDEASLSDEEKEAQKEAEQEEIKDEEIAFGYFDAAAQNGFAKAQYYCGQMFENGLGVDKDYEAAMEYYLQAADQDFAPALNQIGYLYYNGYGVDVDFSTTVYYQKLAALQGYTPAQVNLGYLYENGYGVERNLDTALSYYELAASAGYEGAAEAALRVRAQINEEM